MWVCQGVYLNPFELLTYQKVITITKYHSKLKLLWSINMFFDLANGTMDKVKTEVIGSSLWILWFALKPNYYFEGELMQESSLYIYKKIWPCMWYLLPKSMEFTEDQFRIKIIFSAKRENLRFFLNCLYYVGKKFLSYFWRDHLECHQCTLSLQDIGDDSYL